jgi:lysozyme
MTRMRGAVTVRGGAAGAVVAAALAGATVLVTHWEGKSNTPYADINGVTTVCYGHTGSDATTAKTDAQCLTLLRGDLAAADDVVMRCITHRPMPIAVRAALDSFTYNVGPGKAGTKDGLCVLRNGGMPTIRLVANLGDWSATCDALLSWDKAGGRVVQGLANRRADERALCMSVVGQ